MGTFIRHKITRVVVFVFLSIVFSLNGMYVFAQTDSTAIQNNSKVAFFGVPLGDFSAGTIFSLVVFAVILALITIVIFGFFVLYSVLSSYKRVPRERALVFAWNTLRKYRAHFIGMTVFVVLFSNLHLVLLYFFTHFAPFSWRYPLENFHFFSTPYSGEQFVFSLIGFILGTYIFAGVIRVVLRCSDGAKPNFHHLFVSLRRFIPFLLGTFFYYGISIVGLLFFIFPGMYFASAF